MKWFVLAVFVLLTTTAEAATRQQPESVPAHAAGGEASLVLPDLGQVSFLGTTRERCWSAVLAYACSDCCLVW